MAVRREVVGGVGAAQGLVGCLGNRQRPGGRRAAHVVVLPLCRLEDRHVVVGRKRHEVRGLRPAAGPRSPHLRRRRTHAPDDILGEDAAHDEALRAVDVACEAAVGQLLRALVVAHEVRHVRAGFRDGQIDHHVGRRGVQRPRLDARLDGDGGAGLVAPRRFRRPPDRVRSPALDERVHITPDIGDVRPADGDPSAAGGVGDDVKRDDGVLAQREVDSRPL